MSSGFVVIEPSGSCASVIGRVFPLAPGLQREKDVHRSSSAKCLSKAAPFFWDSRDDYVRHFSRAFIAAVMFSGVGLLTATLHAAQHKFQSLFFFDSKRLWIAHRFADLPRLATFWSSVGKEVACSVFASVLNSFRMSEWGFSIDGKIHFWHVPMSSTSGYVLNRF